MTGTNSTSSQSTFQKAKGDFSYLLVALLAHFLVMPWLPEGTAQTIGELVQ